MLTWVQDDTDLDAPRLGVIEGIDDRPISEDVGSEVDGGGGVLDQADVDLILGLSQAHMRGLGHRRE